MTFSFSEHNIKRFVTRIFKGHEQVSSFNFDLKFSNAAKWEDIDQDEDNVEEVEVKKEQPKEKEAENIDL